MATIWMCESSHTNKKLCFIYYNKWVWGEKCPFKTHLPCGCGNSTPTHDLHFALSKHVPMDLGEKTHTLIPCWMPKPLPSKNQCTGWFAPTLPTTVG